MNDAFRIAWWFIHPWMRERFKNAILYYLLNAATGDEKPCWTVSRVEEGPEWTSSVKASFHDGTVDGYSGYCYLIIEGNTTPEVPERGFTTIRPIEVLNFIIRVLDEDAAAFGRPLFYSEDLVSAEGGWGSLDSNFWE